MEISGKQKKVGQITGSSAADAFFSYADEYLQDSSAVPLSVSLPLTGKAFSPVQTQNFFDGLLPEGFTRRCVAGQLQRDERDYLSILSGLGNECLGAIQISEPGNPPPVPEYRALNLDEIRDLARNGAEGSAELLARSHISLTGASGKTGLYYDEQNRKWYLPAGSAPSTHIVKQSHVRLNGIIANEQLCQLTARGLGIDTPQSFIIQTGGQNDADILFATRRYDRLFTVNPESINGLPVPRRLHQEDFAQALGIPAFRKYEPKGESYLKKMFDLLRECSADPIADQEKLWDRCVFNFLIGNSDAHLKNFSILYSENLHTLQLAPAYDILSTAVYENSTRDLSLGIAGKYSIDDISRKDFEREAAHLGLGVRMAMKRFDHLAENFESALNEAAETLRAEGFNRIQSLKNDILLQGGIHSL